MSVKRGFTLFEVAVSALLLGVMLTVCLQMLSALAAHRRAEARRAWAIQVIANVVERFAAREWGAISPETAAQLTLPDNALQVLPNARLQVDVVTRVDAPQAKRMTATLTWQDRVGQTASPVRLTAWVHRRGERIGEVDE